MEFAKFNHMVKLVLFILFVTSCENSIHNTIFKINLDEGELWINLPMPNEIHSGIELSDHTRGGDTHYLNFHSYNNCKVIVTSYNPSDFSKTNVHPVDSARRAKRQEQLKFLVLTHRASSKDFSPISVVSCPELIGWQYDDGIILSYDTNFTHILIDISKTGSKDKTNEIVSSIKVKFRS